MPNWQGSVSGKSIRIKNWQDDDGVCHECPEKTGKRSVHILVREGHEVAMRAYMHLGYEKVGECGLYDMRFVCMERAL